MSSDVLRSIFFFQRQDGVQRRPDASQVVAAEGPACPSTCMRPSGRELGVSCRTCHCTADCTTLGPGDPRPAKGGPGRSPAFAEIKAGTYSQMEAVKLARDPRITESVFPDPSVPEGALGNKARLWHPDQETWAWAVAPANQATARGLKICRIKSLPRSSEPPVGGRFSAGPAGGSIQSFENSFGSKSHAMCDLGVLRPQLT